MKPICLIPARSGSKGLKNKNMLFLGYKPLIFHTIDAAIQSKCFDINDIYVSTDSDLYKKICEEKGIKVLLRDESLASDTTTTFEVNKDFLKDFDDEQVFVLLQPTSPFRDYKDIQNALKLYENNACDNVVSFTKSDKSLRLFTKMNDEGFIVDNIGIDKGYRRQDKEDIYYPNGAIFISKKSVYLQNKSYFTNRTLMYLMEKKSSVDVDDKLDFINCLGLMLFDYSKRDIENKDIYYNTYKNFTKGNNIILGDSRFAQIDIENFNNCSISGVTINSLVNNLHLFNTNKIDKVLLSIGVNDFIIGYDVEEIKACFDKVIEYFKNSKIYITTIPYTLFRMIDNQKILEVNNYLKCKYNILDLNDYLSENNQLKYEYTFDGLHFTPQANTIIKNKVKKFIGI